MNRKRKKLLDVTASCASSLVLLQHTKARTNVNDVLCIHFLMRKADER